MSNSPALPRRVAPRRCATFALRRNTFPVRVRHLVRTRTGRPAVADQGPLSFIIGLEDVLAQHAVVDDEKARLVRSLGGPHRRTLRLSIAHAGDGAPHTCPLLWSARGAAFIDLAATATVSPAPRSRALAPQTQLVMG